jgi:uncharacterized phage protein gp47/JayE
VTPPSTAEVSALIIAQLEGSISQTIPLLPKAFCRVLAKVLSGVVVLLYKYASWIFLQLFVAHASLEWTTVLGKRIRPLVEWGRLVGAGDPADAVRAEHTISVPVTVQSGDLAAGTFLVWPETGVIFQVLYPVPLNAATVQARVRAVSDQTGGDGGGSIGNAPASTVFEFSQQPPNVARETTVVSTLVQGVDAETPDDYRARVVQLFQAPPQGGAYADYRRWSLQVPGIIRAYPYTGDPGEVDVYVEASAASSGSADGIPTGAQITAVLAKINEADKRPVGAAPNVLPITRTAFGLQITGLNPSNNDIKAQLEAGADEHLRSLEPYIDGLSVLPKNDRVTSATLGGIVEAIVAANGGAVSTVALVGGPVVTLSPGQRAKLGVVSYL